MPGQPSTLAARIRAKYPGVYDDIADIELEQRVSAKYAGVYDDIPRTEATLTRERPAGEQERGNIDLNARPTVKNADGSISTVRSLGVNIDGREVLIPTVSDDGRVLSDDDAIALFQQTGRHLGKFDTPANATAYAEQLHDAQSRQYGGGPGHHPDTLAVERFGKRIPGIQEALARGNNFPSDAAFMKRGPQVGGAAGMVLAGPIGAGVGASAGSLARDQFERGAHVPTRDELGGAAVQGGTSLALSAIPGLSRVAGERVGPALVKNAPRISRAIRGATGAGPLAGLGAGAVTGNSVVGAATAAASRAVTSPAVIRAAGNAATRVGNVPTHAANKAGFSLLSVKALLDALAEEPASTVP